VALVLLYGATMTEPHPLRCRGCEDRFKAADNFILACDHPLLIEAGMMKPFPMSEDDRLFVHFAGCPFLLRSSTTTSAEVLEQIEKIISDRIQELKYPKSHDCVREAILGENQALWAQIKELRQQERE
jgi:hypothetical protein